MSTAAASRTSGARRSRTGHDAARRALAHDRPMTSTTASRFWISHWRRSARVAVAGCALLAACAGGGGTSKTGDTQDKALTLQLAAVENEGVPYAPHIKEFARAVEAESDGSVKIEIHWDAGNPFDGQSEKRVADQVRNGDVDLALVPSRAWDLVGVTSMEALQVPLLVDDWDLFESIAKAPVAKEMMGGLTSIGVEPLALWPESLRHPIGFHQPLTSATDMRGVRLRSPTSRVTDLMATALGYVPIPPGDDATKYEGAESGFVWESHLPGFGTFTGNVTLGAKANTLVANAESFNALSDSTRQLLEQAAQDTTAFVARTSKPEQQLALDYCTLGGDVALATEEQLAEWRNLTAPVAADIERRYDVEAHRRRDHGDEAVDAGQSGPPGRGLRAAERDSGQYAVGRDDVPRRRLPDGLPAGRHRHVLDEGRDVAANPGRRRPRLRSELRGHRRADRHDDVGEPSVGVRQPGEHEVPRRELDPGRRSTALHRHQQRPRCDIGVLPAVDEDRMTATLTVTPGETRTSGSARRHHSAAVPVLVGAWIVAAVSVAVIAHLGADSFGYAASSTRATLVVLAGGCGLVAGGTACRLQDPHGAVGVLSALLGVSWLAASWVAWTGGPSLARSMAMIVAAFLLPLVLHLALVLPRGDLDGWRRPIVVAAYLLTAGISIGRLLVLDPFRDRYCWDNCGTNVLLVRNSPAVARAFVVGWWWLSVAIGSVVIVVVVARGINASPTTRRRLVPAAAPIAVVGATTAIHGVLRLVDPAEHPTSATSMRLFTITALSLLALALAVGWMAADDLRARRAVRRLADDLASAPAAGTLQQVLARTLGDRGLTVAYSREDRHTSVSATGEPVDARPSATQMTVPIERDGECIAVVLIDRSAARTHDIGREIGSAARLAVDNERLRAESLAQLADLRSSRLRIVETADATRRRLERDLHDGVQQRLLALTYQIRLAIDDAVDAGDDELRLTLDIAAGHVEQAFTELRDLAHGLYPVVLSEAGLGPALDTLADNTPLSIILSGIPDHRLAERVEGAAYLTVVGCAQAAQRRGATQLCVRFGIVDDHVEINVDGATIAASDLASVVDRLSAVGGSIVIDADLVHAVIPCE